MLQGRKAKDLVDSEGPGRGIQAASGAGGAVTTCVLACLGAFKPILSFFMEVVCYISFTLEIDAIVRYILLLRYTM